MWLRVQVKPKLLAFALQLRSPTRIQMGQVFTSIEQSEPEKVENFRRAPVLQYSGSYWNRSGSSGPSQARWSIDDRTERPHRTFQNVAPVLVDLSPQIPEEVKSLADAIDDGESARVEALKKIVAKRSRDPRFVAPGVDVCSTQRDDFIACYRRGADPIRCEEVAKAFQQCAVNANTSAFGTTAVQYLSISFSSRPHQQVTCVFIQNMSTINKPIRVFPAEDDDTPLGSFHQPCSVAHVKAVLGITRGGLKARGVDEYAGEGNLAAGDYVVAGYTIKTMVSIKGANVVVPIKNAKRKIKSIYPQLQTALSDFLSGDIRISEIRLNGYLLNPNAIIDETISDGSHLEIVDFDLWLQEQLKKCENPWVRLEQSDYDMDKWAEVGPTVDQKLFVRFGQGSGQDAAVLFFELYNRDVLQNFGRDGKHSIARKEGTAGANNDKWLMEAFFVSTNRRVTAVLLSVKSAAYTDANVKEIKLQLQPHLAVSSRAERDTGVVVEPRAPKDVPRAISPEPARVRASVPPGEIAKQAAAAGVTEKEKDAQKRIPSPDKGK